MTAEQEQIDDHRFAWFQPDLQPYRVPFLIKLAEQWNVHATVFARMSQPDEPIQYGDQILTGAHAELINVPTWETRWGRPRTVYQGGWFQALRRRFTVVVLVDAVHNLTTWLFWCFSFLGGPKIMLFGYGLRPLIEGSAVTQVVRSMLQRLLVTRVAAFAVYTEAGRKALMSMGVDSDRIVVLGNTVDTDYLASLSPVDPRSEVGKQVALHDDRPLLLYVGRMQAAKRPDLLLEAVRHLNEKELPVDLVLIGDGPEAGRVHSAAARLPGVTVLPAAYDPRALACFFAAADLLTIPGRIGLTCVHAFAYGLPSVTVADELVEQSPEYAYLKDGVNSLICRADSPSAYAATIERALADRALLADLRRGAMKAAVDLRMDDMVARFRQGLLLAADGA